MDDAACSVVPRRDAGRDAAVLASGRATLAGADATCAGASLARRRFQKPRFFGGAGVTAPGAGAVTVAPLGGGPGGRPARVGVVDGPASRVRRKRNDWSDAARCWLFISCHDSVVPARASTPSSAGE